jgi:hypothetical protein
MKIRITDKGFANLTGLLGQVEFVDGVSVDEVSKAEAARLGTILAIEEVDTGINPSTTQLMVDLHHKNLEELGIKEAGLRKVVPGEVQASPEVIEQASITTPKAPEGVVRSELTYDFTADDLAALADKQGIAGLRAFADKYKVNDKSIGGLIAKLLALKAEFDKPAQEEPVVEKEVEKEVEDLTEEQKAKLAELEAAAAAQAEEVQE